MDRVNRSLAENFSLVKFIEKLLKLDSNEPIEAIAKTWTAQQTQPALELQRVLYGLWTYAIQLFVVAEQKQEDNADALKASLDAAYAKASNFAVKLLESTKTSTGTLAEIQVLAANWFIRAPHHLLQPILAKDKYVVQRCNLESIISLSLSLSLSLSRVQGHGLQAFVDPA